MHGNMCCHNGALSSNMRDRGPNKLTIEQVDGYSGWEQHLNARAGRHSSSSRYKPFIHCANAQSQQVALASQTMPLPSLQTVSDLGDSKDVASPCA